MKLALNLVLAASLITPLSSLAADAHSHEGHGKTKLELNAGQKWATDDALRTAMTALHGSVSATLERIHTGQASNADYAALGKQAQDQVAYMVQNCKLSPQADAQLHQVIAKILGAADVFSAKSSAKKQAAATVQMAHSLNTYSQYFEHPGWKRIVLAH